MRSNGHGNKVACHLLKGGWRWLLQSRCAKRDASDGRGGLLLEYDRPHRKGSRNLNRRDRRCARYCCCVARLHGSLSDHVRLRHVRQCGPTAQGADPLDIPLQAAVRASGKGLRCQRRAVLPATVVSDHNRIRVASGGQWRSRGGTKMAARCCS